MNKFIFEIDHAGEAATVKFSIVASSEEVAKTYAERLNPSAKLVKVIQDNDVFPTEYTGKFLY